MAAKAGQLRPHSVLRVLLCLCASQASCYTHFHHPNSVLSYGARHTASRSLLRTCTRLRREHPHTLDRPERAVSSTVLRALSTERKVEQPNVRENADGEELDGMGTQPPFSARSRAPKGEDDRLDNLAMQAAKSADMGLRYDPLTAEEEFNGRTWDVWRRDLQISVPLTSFLGRVLIDFQRGVEQENRPLRARQFMETIAGLGPAFIKAGQALSSRPDLLPPEYLKELQKLQDRLPPFPNEIAFKIIEEQLGRPMSEVFERVEPQPVAAASIGQVYKGYLLTGEAVAIKVQRPECEKIIALDIYILRELSGTLSQIIKLLRRDIDLRSIVEEFGKLIYEEIDYLQEARNAQRFAELYGSNPTVYVPRIFWRFSRSKLLVMEWIDGERLTSPRIPEAIKTKLVSAMVQCSLQQMLEKGFFHADPHGGNLLATADGKLVYLDFGMMSEVEAYQRYGILEAVIHLVNRDFRSLCLLYVRLGFIPAGTELAPIETALAKALPDVLGASVDTLNIKNVIGELGDVMYKFPFNLPPYYTAIVRCLGVLEGLAIQVDGKFRIINDAYPYVASRVLTDPQLQDILQYMVLTKEKTMRWSRLENLLASAANAPSAGAATWDMERTAKLFADFILAERNREVRYNIINDVVDILDDVGVDAAGYLATLVASPPASASAAASGGGQAATNFVARALAPLSLVADGRFRDGNSSSSSSSSSSGQLPPAPQSVRDLVNRVAMLSQSPAVSQLGIAPQTAMPALQNLALTTLDNPEIQGLLFETATHLLERISTRAIRFAFAMPQPKSRHLPRLRDRHHNSRNRAYEAPEKNV